MKSHNEQYKPLEEHYLKTRDKETLGKMYLIICSMGRNFVRNYVKKNNLYYQYSSEVIEEKSHDMATIIIARYLNNPNFKIGSASAYVRNSSFLDVMFKNRRHEVFVPFSQLEEAYETKIQNYFFHSSMEVK